MHVTEILDDTCGSIVKMSLADLDEYSVYVGNLDCTVPVADLEELIYELFLQVHNTRG